MHEKHYLARLEEADNPSLYGGKASQLCSGLRNNLPIPIGFVISYPKVQDFLLGQFSLKMGLDAILNELGPVAVRSSAVGEDGRDISFAGQYISHLNVITAEGIEKAIAAIWESAFSTRVMAYKDKKGVAKETPEVGIILQKMIPSDVSGILFSKNPVSDLDERVIEAAWGLGEAVASGFVTPDFFRLGRNGKIFEKKVGKKEVAIRCVSYGGTTGIKLPDQVANSYCLSELELQKLNKLAEQCENVFGQEIDIEWAFYQQNLYLLQCRRITVINN